MRRGPAGISKLYDRIRELLKPAKLPAPKVPEKPHTWRHQEHGVADVAEKNLERGHT